MHGTTPQNVLLTRMPLQRPGRRPLTTVTGGQDMMISGGPNTEAGGLELMIITVTGCLELMIFRGGMERIIQTKWVTG